MTPGDRIEIRGLRVMGVHGVLDEERSRAQPFEVDLAIEADLAPAGHSDALADTIDYGALADEVAAVVAGVHADLLETLAERIANVVGSTAPRASAVDVTVRKLRPPIPLHVESVSVTIHRDLRDVAGAVDDPPRLPG